RSSGKGSRSFCPHCGTQLTFQADDHPDEVDITTCSLDDPEAVPPRDHTYTSGKVHWIQLTDRLGTLCAGATKRIVATCGPLPPVPSTALFAGFAPDAAL